VAAEQIIEAVLSRGPVDEPATDVADRKPEEGKAGEEKATGAQGEPAPGAGEEPAKDAKGGEANDEAAGENGAETKPRPNNFVKRWFVARSGS
jgi:hypothetical protein